MFPNSVFNTPFVTPAAEAYFSDKISGDSWNGDKTLISTLRALLINRIGDNSLSVHVQSLNVNAGTYDGYSRERTTELMHEKFDYGSDSFTIGYFGSANAEGNEKMFRHAKEHFAENGQWERLDAISDFFKRSFDALCFVDTKHRRTLFIIKGYDLRRHHYLPIATLSAMPWYFNPSNGDRATDAEIALLNSLCENTPEKYLEALNVIAKQIDFEQEFVKQSLMGIDIAYEKQRVSQLRNDIERLTRVFRDYQEKINENLKTLNARNIELAGLEDKIRNSDGKSLLVDYFLANKRLKLDSVEGTRINFHVNDYISYFDESMAERNIDNRDSTVYENAPNEADARRLAAAIFLDQTIRVRTCAAYYVDIGGAFDAISGYDFGGDAYDRLPNPHINRYRCLGNYQYQINDRLQSRDLIGVLEYAVASAKSLNFADYTVMSEFFQNIYDGIGGKCFELEDGTQMDLKEVMAYLKEQEEGEKDE